jgi:predicted NBD/HSP70 family sugar kinase
MIHHRDLNLIQRRSLQAVIDGDAPSRLEISHLLGVSPQTMTRTIKGLVENGILDEQSDANGQRGQPSRRLAFRAGSLVVIGLALSTYRLIVTVEDLAGSRLMKDEEEGDFREPGPALELASRKIERALSAFGGRERVVGIGIAAQGFLIERGHVVVSIGNPVAWSAIDLKEYFEAQFGLPVNLQNDAKAIAVGTIREGFARRYSSYACIYLTNGIGGALVHNGQLYEGMSANAGEVGFFVPPTKFRPTVPNFLEAARLTRLDDWTDDMSMDRQVVSWCVGAGAQLSPAVQMAIHLYDVPAVLVCSQLPRVVLQTICDAILVVPIGNNVLGDHDSRKLLKQPVVVPINDTSLNKGACALATDYFLRCSSKDALPA